MKYKSVFDIIGPIMIGPSSSHTAGAVKIGQIAREIFGSEPKKIDIYFYRSFAQTYKGHATDIAIIGGILAFKTDSIKIRNSINIASAKGIEINFITSDEYTDHPNTIKLIMENKSNKIELTAISIGGGAIKIIELNGYKLNFSGDNPTLIVLHKDVYGAVATVTKILADYKVNICYMEVSRLEKDSEALMLIETDQKLPTNIYNEIAKTHICNKLILFDTD